MAQTNINIRMDEDLKKQFDGLCNELGLNMTTAINIFARTVVRQNRIPFEISLNVPNSETIGAFREGDLLLKDPNTRKFSSVEELFEELNS